MDEDLDDQEDENIENRVIHTFASYQVCSRMSRYNYF